MAGIIKENKDVFQSYVLTTAKYDFTVYEKRIMYRLVELAQDELRGIMMRDHMHKIQPTFGGREITMPIADILKNEKDKNYTTAKEAFTSLACKGVEYEDDKIWSFTNIITSPKIEKGIGIAKFDVDDKIWQCMLDFSKGYRKYELGTIMNFKSVYAMRFYELMSGQKSPLSFSLEKLKNILGLITTKKVKGVVVVKEKFKFTKRFEESVLDVAQKELDKSSPYSFTYKPIKERSRGRTGYRITGYTFFPVYIDKNRDPNLERKELTGMVGNITGAMGMLKPEVNDYLLYNIGYTKDEINANKDLFVNAQKEIPDLLLTFGKLQGKSRTKANPKGWIVNALKGKLKDLKK